MMSPSFGTRLDPSFRTTPGGSGDPAVTDSGGGESSKTFKLQNSNASNNQGGNSGPSQTSRRARSGVPPANERRYLPDEVVIEVAGVLTERRIQALASHPPDPAGIAAVALTGTTLFRWHIPDGRYVAAVDPQPRRERQRHRALGAAELPLYDGAGSEGAPASVPPSIANARAIRPSCDSPSSAHAGARRATGDES